MILLTRLLNGSICSASPAGAKSGQGCWSMTGWRRGSVAIRWAIASSRSVPVVAVGRGRPVFEGDASSTLRGYALTEEPWGVMRVAFVRCGSTGRSRGGGVRGLLLVGACFEVSAVEGSGDQYDDVEVVVLFRVDVVFLGLVALRALATPLCWTRGTSCVEFGRRGFTAGRAPSRAERLRDMVSSMTGSM